jgi:hypothetical protein
MTRTMLGSRRGIAAVEFVMVVPLLLLLFVGLVWTGRLSIARATTAVEARHDAWNARQRVKHPQFDFSDTTSGIATASAEQTVAVAWPAASAVPRAEVSVHGDPWGFRTLKLNRPPNWPLMITALRKAGENRADQIDTITTGIEGMFTDLLTIKPELPDLEGVFGTFKDGLGGVLGSLPKGLGDVSGLTTEAEIDAAIREALTNLPNFQEAVMATFLTNPNQAEETMKSYLQMIKTLQEMKGKTMK